MSSIITKKVDRAVLRQRLLNTKRLGFFPIDNPLIKAIYTKMKLLYWTPEEINFKDDRDVWKRIEPRVQRFICTILGLFSQLDGIIIENLVENFKTQLGLVAKENSFFLIVQTDNELQHSETYGVIIDTLLEEQKDKDKLLDAIANFPDVYEIADWAFQHMDSDAPLTERLIAFACIEGIIFSSLFASIYWFKRHFPNQLAGLVKANEFIARDEGMHVEFACLAFHHLTGKWHRNLAPGAREVIGDPSMPSQEKAHSIIRSAVEINENFTRRLMEEKLPGLSLDDMMSYVYSTADSLAVSLGYPPIYNVKNRLDWMITLTLPNKSNFFEGDVTEYSRVLEGSLDTAVEGDEVF